MEDNRNNNYDNSLVNINIDRIKRAERELYYDAFISNNPGHYNTEGCENNVSSCINYYKNNNPFDHNQYIVDQVLTPDIIKNHCEWAEEVIPWAGTASIIGRDEFNPAEYLPYVGLKRPEPVPQYGNSLQLNEIDEDDLKKIQNKRSDYFLYGTPDVLCNQN